MTKLGLGIRMKNMRHISMAGLLIGGINTAYYFLLDALPSSESSKLMLGFVSLIVLLVGVYLGLLKWSQDRDTPLTLGNSLSIGMFITLSAAVVVILLRLGTTALSLSKYDSVDAYFASQAPVSTLFWYSVFGLVYCVMVHVIIRYKYTKSKKS